MSEEEAKAHAEETIMWGASSLYGAGGDTSVAGIRTFILAMLLHPEVQEKARTELDRVCDGQFPIHLYFLLT